MWSSGSGVMFQDACILLFFYGARNEITIAADRSGCPRLHCPQSLKRSLCSRLFRDDAFSDSLSQKADSEASSGPLLDDKASSKNDMPSPCEASPDYGFGGVMGR